MNRRNFIKAASCGALLTGALPSVSHAAAENRPPIPGSLGMLYDSTLCVGCQACVTKCQDINFPERNPQGEQTWSNNDKLSPYTNNIIQVWTSGTGVNKDQEENGYAYIKKQCMHCVDPNCVSVCPVSALKKDPKTGIVHYDKDVCTGCRYCMVACPFNIPGYTYDRALNPLVQKCTLCHPRLQEGKLPGCVEACPTGALVFGKRKDLVKIAWDRITAHPERYQNHVYGEHEMGGTAWMTISGAEFKEVGLNEDLGTKAAGEYTAGALGAVPMVVGIWPVLLGGAYAITKRKEQIAKEEQNDAVNAAVARTEEEAAKKLQASLDKAAKEAAKEKDRAVADEVKKAVAEAEEALRAQLEAEKAEAVAKAAEEAAPQA